MALVQESVERVRLCLCLLDHAAEVGLVEPLVGAQVDAAGARRDRSDPVLGLQRVADLAHRERVEGQREAACDLGRHRDASAGKAHDDRIAELHALESRREMAAGVEAIAKERAHHPIVLDPLASRTSGETPDPLAGTTDRTASWLLAGR